MCNSDRETRNVPSGAFMLGETIVRELPRRLFLDVFVAALNSLSELLS